VAPGFQLGANSTADAYSPAKAQVLGNTEIMDYFLDRLDTLHPRLKKTEMVTVLANRLKEIRSAADEAGGEALTARAGGKNPRARKRGGSDGDREG